MKIPARLWWMILVCCGGLAAPCRAQSLRQEADCAGILIGTAINLHYFSDPEYASILAREFNMVEAETAMKWKTTRPDEETFNFGPGDQVVAFATQHGMKVRGHTLLWDGHDPQWLQDTRHAPQELSALLQEHITRVVEHYRGRVFAWDVVNEAFHDNGKLRGSLWYDSPGIGLHRKGTAYIEKAFRWAHAADPDALLFYNDADAEAVNRKSNAIYKMVKDFMRRHVPIDGVGLQMHIWNLKPDVSSIAANIARFTALGVQVHITEMDVALPVDANGRPTSPSELSRQAEIYQKIATACLRHPGCTALQTWGFTDKHSWVRPFTEGSKGAALPFDENYQPKPAYEALQQALGAKACPVSQ